MKDWVNGQPLPAAKELLERLPPTPYAMIERLIKAAREFLAEETEVAKISYTVGGIGGGEPVWSDELWISEDPQGAALAIELREALKPFD